MITKEKQKQIDETLGLENTLDLQIQYDDEVQIIDKHSMFIGKLLKRPDGKYALRIAGDYGDSLAHVSFKLSEVSSHLWGTSNGIKSRLTLILA